MTSPEVTELELQLKRLEHHNRWMWGLAGAVMAALVVTLISLQLAPEAREYGLPGDSRYLFTIGFSGLIVLFSLYMLLKQNQLHRLRYELFQVSMRGELIRSRLSEMSSLFEGLAGVGAQLELAPVLQTLAEHVRTTLGGQQSSIMLLDPGTEELYCPAVSGEDAPLNGGRLKVGEGIAGWVVKQGEALLLTPEEVAQRFPAENLGQDFTSSMCVPLAVADQVIGALTVTRLSDRAPFTPENVRLVSVFATHIAITIQHIRAQDQMARTLKERDEELRHTQKMDALGRLAGGVAHDFNNMLTVIVALSSRILRELSPGHPMQRHIERIAEAARRGAALTRQLLVFSRKDVVEMKVLDLNSCVAGMAGLLRRLIGEDIELVTRLDPEVGWLRGDETQVQQVAVNLVVHARESMPDGGRITICTGRMTIDQTTTAIPPGVIPGPYVMLSVDDTGMGMEESARPRLFEPFSASGHFGSGLGLATVYGIVQQGGGFITVESQRGRGTTFRIYFPQVNREATVSRLPTTTPAQESLQGTTILLVEDEEDVRGLTRQILEGWGCTVIEARWAGEAAMLAQSHSGDIDLMLTDVVMPGESGGELARWMTETRPDMPVLFMSGYPDDEIVRHGVQTQIASLLHKPFTPEDLLAKVLVCLEGRQRRILAESSAQLT